MVVVVVVSRVLLSTCQRRVSNLDGEVALEGRAGERRGGEDYDNKYVGNGVKGDEWMAKEGLRARADIKFHDNSVMKLRVSLQRRRTAPEVAADVFSNRSKLFLLWFLPVTLSRGNSLGLGLFLD